MAHPVLFNKLLLLVRQLPGLRLTLFKFLSLISPGKGIVRRNHLMAAVEHKPRDLFYGQPACQILSPFPGVKPPVRIGQKLSLSCKILKTKPVPFYDLYPGMLRDPKSFAAFVSVKPVTVL